MSRHDQPQCPRCRRPTPDGQPCDQCLRALEQGCAVLGALLPELRVTVARHDQVARAIRHPKRRIVLPPVVTVSGALTELVTYALAGHALPVNLDAAALQGRATSTLNRRVAALRARHPDPVFPATAGAALCEDGLQCGHRYCGDVHASRVGATRWLRAAAPSLRTDPDFPGVVSDVASLARRVEAMVDRREPDVYVGPCEAVDVRLDAGEVITPVMCGVDVYAEDGDRVAKCPACGARYEVAARKQWLAEQAREVWARPKLIATALAALDVDLTAVRLDQWISRDKRRHESCWPGEACGHIVPVALDSAEVDEDGKPLGRSLYRVGDVLDRVDKLRAEREAREALLAGLVAAR